MIEHNAKIKSCNLDWEDHGMFVLTINFIGDGWGQSIQIILDDPMFDENKKFVGREPAPNAMKIVQAIMKVFDTSFNQINEHLARVCWENDEYRDPIAGFKHVVENRSFFLKDWFP